jgi:hypothetical protein
MARNSFFLMTALLCTGGCESRTAEETLQPADAVQQPGDAASGSSQTGWACDAGERRCVEDRWLEHCPPDGANILRFDCSVGGGGYCLDGACHARSCYGTLFCDGSSLRECSALGVAGDIVKVCELSCVEPSGDAYCDEDWCAPGGTFCDGTDIRVCTAPGQRGEFVETCPEACRVGSSGAICAERICEPGTKTCSANSIMTCNSSGTGYSSRPEACVGELCRDGECVPLEGASG